MQHTRILTLLFLTASFAQAATIRVPTDRPTIQAGINAASNFDTVLVATGTYTGTGNRDINFNGKKICVKGKYGAEFTIIDCQATTHDRHRGFIFKNFEDTTSVLTGFTIKNGFSPEITEGYESGLHAGAGIHIFHSSPLIEHCIIQNGYTTGYGGGISCDSALPIIRSCLFRNNHASNASGGGGGGGGIYCQYGSAPKIESCIFYGNTGGYGGGIWSWYSNPVISNCTFVGNGGANSSANGILVGYGTCTVSNTIIAFGNFSKAIAVTGNAILNMSCCNIIGNSNGDFVAPIDTFLGVNGNFSSDPLFCNRFDTNYTLSRYSPCAESNNSCSTQIGALPVVCTPIHLNRVWVDDLENNGHVLSDQPVITWQRDHILPYLQTKFEIDVGEDTYWDSPDMWDLNAFNSSDTFITYNGHPLVDGRTYYFRVRISNGRQWSEWRNSSFHTNARPYAPLLPTEVRVLPSLTPTLYIYNIRDIDGDSIRSYHFTLYTDGTFQQEVAQGTRSEAPDSTGWTVPLPLVENRRYWWRAFSYDGYEYSAWSQAGSFFANGTPEPPLTPTTYVPADADIEYSLLPTFVWGGAGDFDPLDTVRFKLEIALTSSFTTIVHSTDSISSEYYRLTDSLDFSTQYYWRVIAFDTDGLTAQSASKVFWTWTLGDVNGSHSVSISDLVYLVEYLFRNGPGVNPPYRGDIDGNCSITVADLAYLVQYLFDNGPDPKVGCAN